MSRPVTFTHTVLIDGTDVAGITLAGATIRYGTDTPGSVPEAASAYLELISADAAGNLLADFPEFTFGDAIPSGFVDRFASSYDGGAARLKMGATVEIVTETPTGFSDSFTANYDGGFSETRFTGYITSIDVTPALVTITAVAPSEKLTRVLVSRKLWPAETDLARVARIAAAAGITIRTEGSATNTVSATDDKEIDAPAWTLLSKVAEDAGALLYANRLGEVIYRTRTATAGSTTVTVSPDATLLDGFRLTQELGSIVNSVEVKYGAGLTWSDQDLGSISKYGLRSRSVTLEVDDEDAVWIYGEKLLDRSAEPRWSMTAATVNLKLAAEAGGERAVTDLLGVDLDDDVLLPQLLPASPIPDYQARVLGIDETLDPYSWSLTFALDPAGLTSRS